jgi:SOS-response transcriptional repressor LexA
MEGTLAVRNDRLTPRQLEVLRLIVAHMEKHGAPPTIREIAEHFGFCGPNSVICHIDALVSKGYLLPESRRKGRASGSGRARAYRLAGATFAVLCDPSEAGQRLAAALAGGAEG